VAADRERARCAGAHRCHGTGRVSSGLTGERV
jgi:hypothetical protein